MRSGEVILQEIRSTQARTTQGRGLVIIMKYPDITQMAKWELESELNALNYSNWTREDMEYRNRLIAARERLIEQECIIATQGGN